MIIQKKSSREKIDLFTRILHLGIAVFGLLALATGDMADDYKEAAGIGFFIHGWTGMAVTFFAALRFIYGIMGPVKTRFVNWFPYNKERMQPVLQDIAGLLQFRLPHREPRQGLAALVEMSGLLIIFFLAATGVSLFFIIEPGHKAGGFAHLIKELHEAGEVMLPAFFLVHGGAVILHALAGDHLWRKMLFLKEKTRQGLL